MQEAEIIKSCTNTKTGISYWYCISDGSLANKYLLSKNVYKEDGADVIWSVDGTTWVNQIDISLVKSLIGKSGVN